MLQNLTQSQIEQAFQWLEKPPPLQAPPENLKQLNEMEWFLLSRMLENLLQEKRLSRLQ